MKGWLAIVIGCAMILGVATVATASAAAVAVNQCQVVVAKARSYDKRHHISMAGLAGPCTAPPTGSGPQPRMRRETLCHPNGNGNFCCTFGSGPARCGSCPSMSAPCPH